MVRRSIALSFGAASQLKLILCMERTLEKDETQNQFNPRPAQSWRRVEIPASDLTPQGTCLEYIVCSFRIMTSRSHTDLLPDARSPTRIHSLMPSAKDGDVPVPMHQKQQRLKLVHGNDSLGITPTTCPCLLASIVRRTWLGCAPANERRVKNWHVAPCASHGLLGCWPSGLITMFWRRSPWETNVPGV